MRSWQAVVISRFEVQLTCHKTVERFGDLKQRRLQYLHTFNPKGAARGGAEGAQAPPLAIRILMFIS